MMIIAPSLLAANFAQLQTDIESIQEAPWLHLDVMDGHFVPNLSFGPPIIAAIRPHFHGLFDVHLMVNEPEKLCQAYLDAGADAITFHVEATANPLDLIKTLKAQGVKCGMSLKPGTALEHLKPYLADLDIVLVMSVEPGFGGQAFQPSALERIALLKQWRDENSWDYHISVDGGVSLDNAPKLFTAGADVLVAGSTIFKAPDRTAMIEALTHAR